MTLGSFFPSPYSLSCWCSFQFQVLRLLRLSVYRSLSILTTKKEEKMAKLAMISLKHDTWCHKSGSTCNSYRLPTRVIILSSMFINDPIHGISYPLRGLPPPLYLSPFIFESVGVLICIKVTVMRTRMKETLSGRLLIVREAINIYREPLYFN